MSTDWDSWDLSAVIDPASQQRTIARLARIAASKRRRDSLLTMLSYYQRLTANGNQLVSTATYQHGYDVLLDFDVIRAFLTDYEDPQNQVFLDYLFFATAIPFSFPLGTLREIQKWLRDVEDLSFKMQVSQISPTDLLPTLRRILAVDQPTAEPEATADEPLDVEAALATLNIALNRLSFILTHPNLTQTEADYTYDPDFRETFLNYLKEEGTRSNFSRNNQADALNLAIAVEHYRTVFSEKPRQPLPIRLFLTNTRVLLDLSVDVEQPGSVRIPRAAIDTKNAVIDQLREEKLPSELLPVPCVNPRDLFTLHTASEHASGFLGQFPRLHSAFAGMSAVVRRWAREYAHEAPRPDDAAFRASAEEFANHAVAAWTTGASANDAAFSAFLFMEQLRSTARSVAAAHDARKLPYATDGVPREDHSISTTLRDVYANAGTRNLFRYQLRREAHDETVWTSVMPTTKFGVYSEPALPHASPMVLGWEYYHLEPRDQLEAVELQWQTTALLDDVVAMLRQMKALPAREDVALLDADPTWEAFVVITDDGAHEVPWQALARFLGERTALLAQITDAMGAGTAKPDADPIRIRQVRIPTPGTEWTIDIENLPGEFYRYMRVVTGVNRLTDIARAVQRTLVAPSSAILLESALAPVMNQLPPLESLARDGGRPNDVE